LIDCVATFSCGELCPYPEFVVYTIISNILFLPRTELKSKIIDGPDILSVANKIPVVVSSYSDLVRLYVALVSTVKLHVLTILVLLFMCFR
jgi:26S proteasome regulatory subunit N7